LAPSKQKRDFFVAKILWSQTSV